MIFLQKKSHHLFLRQILRDFGFYSFFLTPFQKCFPLFKMGFPYFDMEFCTRFPYFDMEFSTRFPYFDMEFSTRFSYFDMYFITSVCRVKVQNLNYNLIKGLFKRH